MHQMVDVRQLRRRAGDGDFDAQRRSADVERARIDFGTTGADRRTGCDQGASLIVLLVVGQIAFSNCASRAPALTISVSCSASLRSSDV
jgi:hypothetical protein